MKGFTLVELLIVFAIIGVIAGISITSFSAYNRSQVLGGAVSEVADFLRVTRSKSISQVKPQACGVDTLDGYEVTIAISGSTYQQNVVCAGIDYVVSRKKLPPQVIFQAGSASSIRFNVSNGTVSIPGDIIISGFGKTQTITTDKVGNISTN